MKKRVSLVAVVVMVLLLVGCGKTYQKEYDLGVRYLSEGNYEEAVIAFTAAIEIEPNHAEAYVGLADTYISMSDLVQARDALAGGLGAVDNETELHGKLSDVEYDMGQEELKQGNCAEAVGHFEESISYDPEHEEAYEELADCYLSQGETDSAISILKDGIDMVPEAEGLREKVSDITYDCGMEFYEVGEFELSIPWFEEAIEYDPDGVDAYLSLADAYFNLGEFEKALAVLNDGLSVVDDTAPLEEYLSEFDERKASVDFNETIDKDAMLSGFEAEFLSVQIHDPRSATVTLGGVSLRDSYLTDLSSSNINSAEYDWGVSFNSQESSYAVSTSSWALEPGRNVERALADMQHSIWVNGALVADASMSYTANSISWQFYIPDGYGFDFSEIEEISAFITDISTGQHVTRTYKVQ